MIANLKTLTKQVVVITGASSEIGLATAQAAAARGAKLVLAVSNVLTVKHILERFDSVGQEAIAVPCNIIDRAEVDRVADEALAVFGQIGVWINVATPVGKRSEANGRSFDTNLWGIVIGSLAALPALRKTGGALINVGNDALPESIPFRAACPTLPHGDMAFTDFLRAEVENDDKAPIAITFIQPAAVNGALASVPQLESSQETIDPIKVANAILDAAGLPATKRVGAPAQADAAITPRVPAFGERTAAIPATNVSCNELI